MYHSNNTSCLAHEYAGTGAITLKFWFAWPRIADTLFTHIGEFCFIFLIMDLIKTKHIFLVCLFVSKIWNIYLGWCSTWAHTFCISYSGGNQLYGLSFSSGDNLLFQASPSVGRVESWCVPNLSPVCLHASGMMTAVPSTKGLTSQVSQVSWQYHFLLIWS